MINLSSAVRIGRTPAPSRSKERKKADTLIPADLAASSIAECSASLTRTLISRPLRCLAVGTSIVSSLVNQLSLPGALRPPSWARPTIVMQNVKHFCVSCQSKSKQLSPNFSLISPLDWLRFASHSFRRNAHQGSPPKPLLKAFVCPSYSGERDASLFTLAPSVRAPSEASRGSGVHHSTQTLVKTTRPTRVVL